MHVCKELPKKQIAGLNHGARGRKRRFESDGNGSFQVWLEIRDNFFEMSLLQIIFFLKLN